MTSKSDLSESIDDEAVVIFLTVVILAVGGDTFKRYDIEAVMSMQDANEKFCGSSLNMRMSGTKTIKFQRLRSKRD